jgi:putative addiction module killer protein
MAGGCLRLTEAFTACEWALHLPTDTGCTVWGVLQREKKDVANRIQLDTIMTFDVQLTEAFDAWLSRVRDVTTRARITARLRQAGAGHLGDWKSLGSGLAEMRLHWGPGWRLYFTHVRGVLIVMLAGGDKSTQSDDIRRARQMLCDLIEEGREP